MSKAFRETRNNPIVKATADLIIALRNADLATLDQAHSALQDFADSWLVNDKMQEFPGARGCCLSDTDTTECVKEAVGIWKENQT